MDATAEVFRQAMLRVFEVKTLAIIAGSSIYGTFCGGVPGLTATMAVALLVPLTFFLDYVQALAAIVTTVSCSIFAGDIPATFVRIPGTPASAAYTNDAYAMTLRGQSTKALAISLIFSIVGGLFGTLVLIVAAPQLARFATKFTSYEYFWLYVLGLTCAWIVSDQSRWKGALALLLGLLLSSVGLGTDYSVPRMTFGFNELINGVNFIPAMIGLFGISEVLRKILSVSSVTEVVESGPVVSSSTPIWAVTKDVLWLLVRRPVALMRSSIIGTFIGALPGAGADIAAWITYAISKRMSHHPEEYGHGSEEGLADAGGANNAALGGAWIPALVFGIPGDSVTAIAIGVLMMKNIRPGPDIFDVVKNPKQATLVFSIYITFVLANLILIPFGLLAIRLGTWMVRIPRSLLVPIIVMSCVVGAYALNASYFDVMVMLIMGVAGLILESYRVPLGPIVLGLILGSDLEHKFLQCITKSSEWHAFLRSPISIGLAVCCLLLWCAPLLAIVRRPLETGDTKP